MDGIQTTTIRTLQEELSQARAQLERWRVEAVQVQLEAWEYKKTLVNFRLPKKPIKNFATIGRSCKVLRSIITNFVPIWKSWSTKTPLSPVSAKKGNVIGPSFKRELSPCSRNSNHTWQKPPKQFFANFQRPFTWENEFHMASNF